MGALAPKVVMLLSILVLGRSGFLRDDFDLLEYEFPENKDIKIYPIIERGDYDE